MDQTAILSEIIDHPDDDAPRLVFADWLEENGDEADRTWAEFIRVQIERARLPTDDDRQAELDARERRLAVAHALDWKLPGEWDLHNLRFRRGFPEQLLATPTWLGVERQPLSSLPIRELSLLPFQQALWRLPDCADLGSIQSLKMEGFADARFTEGSIRALLEAKHLTHLRALHINHNRLGNDALARLLALPAGQQLETLAISDNDLDHAALSHLTTRLPWPRLRQLTVSDSTPGDEGAQALFSSDLWPRLEALDFFWRPSGGDLGLDRSLETCTATHLSLAAFPDGRPTVTRAFCEALSWGRLSSLSLAYARFQLGEIDRFLDHPGLANLEHLALRYCHLSAWDMKRIAACPLLGNLRHLDVRGNRGAFTALAGSKTIRQLRSLAGTDEDAGVIAFLRSPNAAHLRRLALEGHESDANPHCLSNPIAEALADSPHLCHLTTILGGFGSLSDKGARSLARSANLPNLTVLSLEGCPIRAGGQRALMEAEHIAWVGFLDSDVRQDDVKEMRQHRYRGIRWGYWLAADDPAFPAP
jgi:uncharacterized protein (TIGR02996 family)